VIGVVLLGLVGELVLASAGAADGIAAAPFPAPLSEGVPEPLPEPLLEELPEPLLEELSNPDELLPDNTLAAKLASKEASPVELVLELELLELVELVELVLEEDATGALLPPPPPWCPPW
jgi:hypothetical protein